MVKPTIIETAECFKGVLARRLGFYELASLARHLDQLGTKVGYFEIFLLIPQQTYPVGRSYGVRVIHLQTRVLQHLEPVADGSS